MADDLAFILAPLFCVGFPVIIGVHCAAVLKGAVVNQPEGPRQIDVQRVSAVHEGASVDFLDAQREIDPGYLCSCEGFFTDHGHAVRQGKFTLSRLRRRQAEKERQTERRQEQTFHQGITSGCSA